MGVRYAFRLVSVLFFKGGGGIKMIRRILQIENMSRGERASVSGTLQIYLDNPSARDAERASVRGVAQIGPGVLSGGERGNVKVLEECNWWGHLEPV